MARYIDADKLVEHIKDLPTWYEDGLGWHSTKYPDGMFDCDDVIESINNQPVADVEEVRHGRYEMGIDEGDYEYGTCSVCGYNEYNAFGCCLPHNYCPNCGAKMDGKGESDA